jgi:hypothetical protein
MRNKAAERTPIARPPRHVGRPESGCCYRGRVEAELETRTAGRSGRTAVLIIAVIVFAVAAIVGAYLDWIWWPVYSGLVITLAAGAILFVGGVLALIGRGIHSGIVRRIALVVLVVGVGLVAGQNLGPSREPLINPSGGTITLRLESPVVGVATGPANCTNVASATEFAVSGDPNIRLDTPDRPFVSIYLDVGDRWQVLRDTLRKDGVRLDIGVTAELVSDAGKPSTIGMQAAESSTLKSTFSNAGGSIRFANLVAQSGPDFNGQSMDLAGTLEWTCGAAPP